MLTCERILDVFQDHLEQDYETEVVKVRRGYLVLQWDERGEDYQFMDLCETRNNCWTA
jgi:hypothetical protein